MRAVYVVLCPYESWLFKIGLNKDYANILLISMNIELNSTYPYVIFSHRVIYLLTVG
jgi:hypothetical protein